jgi:hypothetical protein
MEIHENKIDEMVLALLYLTSFQEPKGFYRAWKGHDWNALNRLHEKGYISNPKSKAKSVSISEEGIELARKLFEQNFQVK